MLLHCLGTAGYHPSESRHTSCYFLPESGALLDAGTGVFRLAPLIQTDSIDILLSHTHLDHVIGLTFLLDTFAQRPVKQVRVWGKRAKLNAVREHLFNEDIFPVPLDVQWRAIDESDSFELANSVDGTRGVVTWREQSHPGGSVAYRIDWAKQSEAKTFGRSILYATDTTGAIDQPMRRWMDGVDLLVHECNFRDTHQQWAELTGHCFVSRVAEVAAATKPKRVLLVHLNPLDESSPQGDLSCEEVDSLFEMPVCVAKDRDVVEF